MACVAMPTPSSSSRLTNSQTYAGSAHLVHRLAWTIPQLRILVELGGRVGTCRELIHASRRFEPTNCQFGFSHCPNFSCVCRVPRCCGHFQMGNTEIHFRSWTYVPSLIEVLRVGICCCDRFSSITAGSGRKTRDLDWICYQCLALQPGIGLAGCHFSRFLLRADSHRCLPVSHSRDWFGALVR